ncbi:MAG: MFS transporter [Acetobacteraceae bacterium]
MALSRTTRVNLMLSGGHFLSHFYVLCLPPMFLVWQSAFHVSFAALGLTIALMSGTTAILQTPVGFLVDRYGARPFLVGGALLMSLSVAAMGLATSFWQLLLFAVLSGVGNSVIHPADYAIISGSVDHERIGRSFALHTFAGNVGFSAAPPVIAVLALSIGWRGSLILVGLLGVPVVIAVLLQSGVLLDQAHHETRAAGPRLSGRDLLTGRTMLLFFAFYMLGSMAGSGVQSWLVTILHAVKSMSLPAASAALTGYLVGTTLGILVGGWTADAHKRHVLSLGLIPIATGAVLLLAVNWAGLPDLTTIVLIVAAGLAIGISRTPRDLMLKDSVPAGQIGKVFGFVSSGLPLGSAITPVPFGFLIDRGHPELVLVLVAAILLLSILCCWAARGSTKRGMVAVAAE